MLKCVNNKLIKEITLNDLIMKTFVCKDSKAMLNMG